MIQVRLTPLVVVDFVQLCTLAAVPPDTPGDRSLRRAPAPPALPATPAMRGRVAPFAR
jgi:hypothetical protein